MKIKLLLLVGLIWASSGCASRDVMAPGPYSLGEIDKMTFCTLVADSVRYVATEKLKGTHIDKVRSYYESKKFSDVNLAVVDKVYGEEFSSVWDYTISYFGECSYNLAGITPERITPAESCMNTKLIADVAFSYKEKGAPSEEAYAHFASVESKVPNAVIDYVYNSKEGREKVSWVVWEKCISNIYPKGISFD